MPDEFDHFVEISDLTAATLTEDQYFQYLSTPITIRFEKIEPRSKYESTGERLRSTWLNCTRARLPNVDAVQADEEIQRLNRRDNKKGLTLMKKQQSLGPNAQTQLTKAERDLSAAVQDRRFHIILKQLDWTERSIASLHKKGSKRHLSKKPRTEKVSMTAYFSRCPKPNQVPSTLYRQLEMKRLQAHAQVGQQRQQRDMTALRVREARDRDEREHEEKMAEHKARQEEAIATRMHEQRMMSQQQQQIPARQQMPPGQSMHPNHQVAQYQTGPGPQGHPQGRPPMVQQQAGPLPQAYAQNRPLMAQQPGPMPQQHPQSQPHVGPQQGRPQQPLNFQSVPTPAFRQMAPQQGQQGPPQNFRQMPPNGGFVHQPTNSNRPIIDVVTENEKQPKHMRGHSQYSIYSSDSSNGSLSVFDSDSEHSSTSTKRSSLASGSSGLPQTTRALPNKPKKMKGGADSRYIIVDTVDESVLRDRRRRPITRRHGKAYIQTGSERKIEVPGPTSRSQVVDPLTQVREAYLAGHADHERLISEVNKTGASATKYQSRRLSRSDAQGSRQPKIFQEEDLPRFRRVSASEVGRELKRERARDFGAEFFPGMENGGMDRDFRYDDRDLERDFVVRMRLGDEWPDYRSSPYDGQELNTFRERQRQRQREVLARDEHEDILRGIAEDSGRHSSRSPEQNPYVDVPLRSSDGRFEARAGFGPRGRF